jgi:hypothetical protein
MVKKTMHDSTTFNATEKAEIDSYALGISMERWAPACWRLLNALAFGANNNSDWFATLLTSLAPILPCPICRDHFRTYMNEIPPPSGTKIEGEASQRWLVTFHNSVSRRTGSVEMRFEDVREDIVQLLHADDGHALAVCDDLWTFLFAVGALYVEDSQTDSVRIFIEELCNMFPVKGAADALVEHPFSLETAGSLFASVLGARNLWADTVRASGAVGPPAWTLYEAIERFAPPQLFVDLGATDSVEHEKLAALFRVRREGMRDARQRAHARIAGTAGKDASLIDSADRHHRSPAALRADVDAAPSTTPAGTSWSTGQIVGLVCGLGTLVFLLSLIILMADAARRKRQRAQVNGPSPTGQPAPLAR